MHSLFSQCQNQRKSAPLPPGVSARCSTAKIGLSLQGFKTLGSGKPGAGIHANLWQFMDDVHPLKIWPIPVWKQLNYFWEILVIFWTDLLAVLPPAPRGRNAFPCASHICKLILSRSVSWTISFSWSLGCPTRIVEWTTTEGNMSWFLNQTNACRVLHSFDSEIQQESTRYNRIEHAS